MLGRTKISAAISLATTLLLCSGLTGQATKPARLSSCTALYVGQPESARGKAFLAFLTEHLAGVTATGLDGSAVEKAKAVDVVILDWDQGKMDEGVLPLGERGAWTKPTLLIGSSGLMLSAAWRVRGGLG